MERLFNLDPQLLFDTVLLAVSMLVLFTLLSYLLFNPVRDLLEKRRQRIADDQEDAKRERTEAIAYKMEYESKLKEVDKEVQEILSEARKKALKNENQIIAEAKEEAGRIIARAQKEAELEKKRVKDEVKQEIITVAALMSEKIIAASVDEETQNALFEQTLKEMGDKTWLNE